MPISAARHALRSDTVGDFDSVNESTERKDSSGALPPKATGGRFAPTWTPRYAPPVDRRPRTRSSHPERMLDPGAARSISPIAAKCERFGLAMPTALTMPSDPFRQYL